MIEPQALSRPPPSLPRHPGGGAHPRPAIRGELRGRGALAASLLHCAAPFLPGAALLLVCAALLALPSPASARRSYINHVPNGPALDCLGCHSDGDSGPLNAFGLDFGNARLSWVAIWELDSDGDGQSNGLELGDPCGIWSWGGVPMRSTEVSNAGDPAMRTSAAQPSCAGLTRPDGGLGGDAALVSADPTAADYPPTEVRGACAIGAAGMAARGSAPLGLDLLLLLLGVLGLRRRRRARASVAAAAAAAREATDRPLTHGERVILGGRELRVGADRHIAPSEGLPLVGRDRRAAADPRDRGEDQGEGDQACSARALVLGTQHEELRTTSPAVRHVVFLAFVIVLGASACASESAPYLPNHDRAYFDSDVMPVLARDCAFAACHGDEGRFFRLYAPGRTRLLEGEDPWAPLTAEESAANYDRALSMIFDVEHPAEALLVRKPLSAAAGGAFHRGVDEYELDVYDSPDAIGYLILHEWARRAVEARP
ncbi:MAG: hypothetical protein OEY14_04375 [Myxococcales bacterium]|nr:hypothetical protein [Myxococcales bacterium]